MNIHIIITFCLKYSAGARRILFKNPGLLLEEHSYSQVCTPTHSHSLTPALLEEQCETEFDCSDVELCLNSGLLRILFVVSSPAELNNSYNNNLIVIIVIIITEPFMVTVFLLVFQSLNLRHGSGADLLRKIKQKMNLMFFQDQSIALQSHICSP